MAVSTESAPGETRILVPASPASRSWPWSARWLWIVLCGAVCAWQGPPFVKNLRPGPQEVLDFFQEWASARNYFHGLPVYEPQAHTMELYLGYRLGPHESAIKVNAHPPSSVLLALPFAKLAYPDAFLAWNLLSLAALAVSIRLVVRELKIPFSFWSLLPTLALLLLCNPFRQQIIQGQLNLILLLLLTGLWVAERSGRSKLAGLFLGTATAIKLFPGLFFVYYALRKRWDICAWGIAGFCGLTALTATLFGPTVYLHYIREALPEVTVFYDWWPNVSLPGFWRKLFDGPSGRVIPLWHSPLLARVGILLSWGIVLTFLARAVLSARSRAAYDRTFGLTLTAMLLLSPITWDHYAVLLLLPLALLWMELPPGDRRNSFFVCVILLFMTPMIYWYLLIGATMKTWLTMVATPWQALVALSLPCYALVGLFVLGLRLCGEAAAPPRAIIPAARN